MKVVWHIKKNHDASMRWCRRCVSKEKIEFWFWYFEFPFFARYSSSFSLSLSFFSSFLFVSIIFIAHFAVWFCYIVGKFIFYAAGKHYRISFICDFNCAMQFIEYDNSNWQNDFLPIKSVIAVQFYTACC